MLECRPDPTPSLGIELPVHYSVTWSHFVQYNNLFSFSQDQQRTYNSFDISFVNTSNAPHIKQILEIMSGPWYSLRPMIMTSMRLPVTQCLWLWPSSGKLHWAVGLTHHNGVDPEIYIQDPSSGVQYELEGCQT